ncbi:hypothetical protein [Reyranella sp.]|uniref:hypothetical protein n=1 Tax=Reyranella sp. TaxID=1929291 RepID=UPI003BAC7C32
MGRLRLLVWLVALVALMAPPGLAVHALAAPEGEAVEGCPDHAPPPDPCPEGADKHASGTCCPLMAGALALMAPSAGLDAPPAADAPEAPPAASLTSRMSAKDPPPPRV